MAKRRRRKITIKNSSLFAFFALVSLFLLDENCAYQHQNPYRFNSNQAQLQHHYLPSISTSTSINHNQQAQQQQQQQQYQHQLSAQLQFAGSGREPATEKSPRSSSHSHHHQQHRQQHQHQDQQLHSPQQQQQQQQFNQLHLNQLHHLQQHQHQHQHHPHRILPTAQLCSSLPTPVARLLKLCKLISQSPDADEVVSNGASKGLAECRSQFKHERWNCTHSGGDHQLLTSELAQSIGNPESGFIHAIAAAGIVHSIATACSVGNLSDCACDKSRIGTIVKRDEQPVHWKWGGCSNNIRHGMLFAKHLVELLDAVHQHSRLMQLHQQQQQQQHPYRHQLGKRSTTTNRDHQLFNNNHQRPPSEHQVDHQRNFCQQNHNISQAKHHELIKSLLSRNSLEKHQEFRLAMNMHNNKIGRNAVAKNMELHCRCHGLSGSCSLKTCWLSLPSLQVIGKYLKKKYESSVHLPKAVNLNKLIPMMDRQEISAILSAAASQEASSTNSEDLNTNAAAAAAAASSMLEFGQADNANQQQQHQSSPEYAALISSSTQAATRDAAEEDLSGHEPAPTGTPIVTPAAAAAPAAAVALATTATRAPLGNVSFDAAPDERLALYERHHPLKQPPSSQVSINEIPTNLEPLSQQQYQALLKDMKLCNSQAVAGSGGSSSGGSSSSHLQTRDLNQYQAEFGSNLRKKHQQQQQQNYGHILNGQQTKLINQQLSHLLHSSQKDELIHLHKSPKYCDADLRHGFLGIQSRVCSSKESAPDSCDRLCCGRGYRTLILHTVNSCNCKFQYCCKVTCDLCPTESRVLVCN